MIRSLKMQLVCLSRIVGRNCLLQSIPRRLEAPPISRSSSFHAASRLPEASKALASNFTHPTTAFLTRTLRTCEWRRPAWRRSLIHSTAKIPELDDDRKNWTHEELHKFSISDPDIFWGQLAKSRLQWIKDFDRVSDCNMAEGKIKWFLGGKLNVALNCVDRHAKKNPNKVALIWEKDEPGQEEHITYSSLSTMVGQMANVLKRHGVKRLDRVAIYMPSSPLAVTAMLACARIGAIHSVVFAGFSADALATRIQDAQAETVITADLAFRGGKSIDLKATVDTAVSKCSSVKRVLVTRRTDAKTSLGSLDVDLDVAMKNESGNCSAEVMDSEDSLFMLYTSGSTGRPKGVVHSTAGYLMYASFTLTTAFEYDADAGDIFGCVADIGWITGHTYGVYATLCNGGTTLIFESTPTYPDPGRYWETIQRLKITHFYAAPTALRMLLKFGDEYVTKYDRSSLKIIGTVGEPINNEAWEWYHNVVGERRCPVIDTWWQTETGGVCIAPRPSTPYAKISPAMPMRPMFGIEPVLLDDKGVILKENNVSGTLCLASTWPGMATTIYGNHERYVETYFKPFPGLYFTGDGAFRDHEGHYQMTGRMDDVINISGHRLGTAEVEDVVTEHPAIAETAVVGFPHGLKGQSIYAYVVLKEDVGGASVEQIIKEVRESVKKNIASYAIPEYLQVCSSLPKTRSGKIMRRILRQVAAHQIDKLGDISTLADPSVVDDIIEGHRKLVSNK